MVDRDDLTKAEASKKIDELQARTGRRPPPANADESPPPP